MDFKTLIARAESLVDDPLSEDGGFSAGYAFQQVMGDLIQEDPDLIQEDWDVDPFQYTPYLPQPGKPTQFFESTADITIFGGAAGASKSSTLLLKALRYAATPGYVSMIFRRTSKDVISKGSLWDKTKEIYNKIPGAEYRDSNQYLDWRFPNGSSISFGHAENLTTSKLGAEIAFVGIDEIANEWTEKEFLFLLSRNRTNCGVSPQFVGTCNPNCDSFLIKNEETGVWKIGSWLEWWIDDDGFPIQERSGIVRYFYRYSGTLFWASSKEELLEEHPEIYDQVNPNSGVKAEDLIKSFTFISANVYDNPAFLENNPGYLANLLMMDDVEKQRFLLGNWKISDDVGVIFNPSNFQYIDSIEDIPRGATVRFWDFAAKEEVDANPQSCFTASQKWRFVQTSRDVFDIYILHVFWEQTLDADSAIELAMEDGRETHVAWELEPGSQSIKYSAQLTKDLKAAVRGVQCTPLKPSLDKVSRAKPWSRMAKLGRVYVLRNEFWNNEFKSALIKFNGKKIPRVTDIIDAGSGCYQWYIECYRKPSKTLAGKPTGSK